ncbi:Fungal specific transcription factor domain [Ceratobasidium sp. AG-Ba]|nr:Fungal specific transcription factor domain [Ceratobasidium sp. AG-Ba]
MSTPAVNDDDVARTSSPQAAPQAQSNIQSSTAALHNSSKPDGVVVAPAAPTAPSLVAPPVDPRVRPFRRMLPPATREVFRCGARVFLHSILSGERPRVHDIIQAVGTRAERSESSGSATSRRAESRRRRMTSGSRSVHGREHGAGHVPEELPATVVREVDMQTNELLTSVLGERAGSGEFM